MWLLLSKQVFILEWKGKESTNYKRMLEKDSFGARVFQITEIMSSVSQPKILYNTNQQRVCEELLGRVDTAQYSTKEERKRIWET